MSEFEPRPDADARPLPGQPHAAPPEPGAESEVVAPDDEELAIGDEWAAEPADDDGETAGADAAERGPGDRAAPDGAASTVRPAPTAVPPQPGLPAPVAAVLDELGTLGERELAEHPDVYERVHAELQSALSAIDDA
jgi:hypothetical protein